MREVQRIARIDRHDRERLVSGRRIDEVECEPVESADQLIDQIVVDHSTITERQIFRTALSVDPGGKSRIARFAGIGRVVNGILLSPRITAENAVVVVEFMIDLEMEIALRIESPAAVIEAGGVQSVTDVIVVRIGQQADDTRRRRVDAKVARVVLKNVERGNAVGRDCARTGGQSRVSRRIDRGPGLARIRVTSADDIPEDALFGQRSVNRSRPCVRADLALTLVVEEEECPVLDDRSAHVPAILMLKQKRPGDIVQVVPPLVGRQRAVAMKVEEISMKIVGARLGHQRHLSAARTTELGRRVAGDDPKFLKRIRIRADRRKLGSARRRFVDVDAVERVVERPVARSVDVRAAAGVRSGVHAWLQADKDQGIATARSRFETERQIDQRLVVHRRAEVARSRCLHALVRSAHFDNVFGCSDLERRIDRQRHADSQNVGSRNVLLEALHFDSDRVRPELHAVKNVNAG